MQLINAKQKALSVIDSCQTLEHTNCAKNYIELLNNRFDDFTTYVDLKRELELKKEELAHKL